MKRLAALVALVMLIGCCAAAEPALVTVTGRGAVAVEADCVCMAVGVREENEDALEAQRAANTKINAVSEAIEALGVEGLKMETGQFDIYPRYDYSASVETIVGYSADVRLTVTIPSPDAAGNVIDTAFGAGANVLDYVRFAASDTADAYEEALRLAVADAYSKARIIAEASGMALSGVSSVTQENYGGDFGWYADNLKVEEDTAGTVLLPAAQTVTASITAVYEMVPAETD